MKKRTISLLLAVCFLFCLFPTAALAADPSDDEADEPLFSAYSAIGDSICAGFAQLNYEYVKGFSMDDNIQNSPKQCYVRLVGSAFGIDNPGSSTTYNLGKCGCNTAELLDILANPESVYQGYLRQSDLITLEIGSNDLLMAVVDKILAAAGTSMSHQEAMVLAEPVLTGDVDGIVSMINYIEGMELGEEQMEAIQAEFADEKLEATLTEAYSTFVQNFPVVVEDINGINGNTKLVVLNYYNPYGELTGASSTIAIIDGFIAQMNNYTEAFCAEKSLTYVDISDIDSNIGDPHPSFIGHMQIAERIVFALANCINATADKGGTITPSGLNVVKNGENRTFNITPDSGYLIGDVKVDGVSVGVVGTYTFENVTADHTIGASFKLDTGSLSPDGAVYYKTYTALGDSITAGYSHTGYDGDYSNPKGCYVELAATSLGVETTYNLGLLGQKSGDLLDVLTNPDNEYHDRFAAAIAASNLVTIDIGSNDLTMALLNIIYKRLGSNLDEMTPQDRMEAIGPLLAAMKSDDFYTDIQKYLNGAVSEAQIKEIIAALRNENEISKALDEGCAQFDANWDGIIAGVRAINQNVSIVALGLYDVAPQLGSDSTEYKIESLSEEYISKMNEHIKNSEAVKKEKYIYVDTMDTELITAGYITIDPHPSDTGHEQMALKIRDAVLNDFTASGGDGVTVSPNGMRTVAYGITDDYSYTYTFTPAGGTIRDIYLDGSRIDLSSGSYTFKEVTGNHAISASGAVMPYVPDTVPVSLYSVTTGTSAGGKIESSAVGSVLQGTDVTILIIPDPGYEIDYVTLDGQALSTGGIVTIKNIAANHSVYAAFKASSGSNEQKNPFKDIKSTDWFYEAAMYGFSNGIIKGTSEVTFDPNSTVNLAMFRTLLYQLEKEPSVTFDSSFSFVANGKWFTNAFIWAIKNGITIQAGFGATNPEDKITREEIVTLLYQYAKYKGYEVSASADLKAYADSSKVSDWAGAAMQWAVAEGLVKGTGNAHLAPGNTATRAEIVQLIYRFIAKYGK
ncbi:MAG: GDSL-type esterase/lipase family protein [Oscillospiraceae bacterium]